MRALLIAAAILLHATFAQAGAPPDIGRLLLDGYIRPVTTQFSGAAGEMTGALDAYCSSPDAATEAALRARFDALVEAWFRVLILRFGPLVEDNRFEKIFFWPDSRGATLRQVQAILAGRDAAAADPEDLAAKSVAVQGLVALEFALFGSGSEAIGTGSDDGRFRCAYALAVSKRIAATASAIAGAWAGASPYAHEFADPGPDNDIYRTDEEVTAEAVKAMATGLSYLSTAVIMPFLGADPDAANYRRAPFWRSGATIPAIRSAVAGLGDFYAAAGFAGALDDADRWIDGSLQLELRNSLQALEAIDAPVEDAVMAGPDRDRLTYVVIALDSLHGTVETRLAQATGVAVGFNALDGD